MAYQPYQPYQPDYTPSALPAELLDQVAAEGFDALPELLRIVINAAMQAERLKYLGVIWVSALPSSVQPSAKTRLTASSPRR